jgi:hypothetical protein
VRGRRRRGGWISQYASEKQRTDGCQMLNRHCASVLTMEFP